MEPIDPHDLDNARSIEARRPGKPHGLVLGQLTGNKGPAPGVLDERRLHTDRRRQKSLAAFLYGNIRPRRRASRRTADDHRYIFDWHEPKLLYIALAIVLFSCTDALFTLNLLHIGATEANVAMDSLLSSGVQPFLWVKISTTIISVLALVFAAQRRFMGRFKVLRILQVICVGYGALIVYEIYLFCLILSMDPFTLGSLFFFY